MPLSHIEHFLVQTTDMARTRGTGVVDHIAFRATGLPQMLELNYDSADAQGLHAEVMASELHS